MTRFAFVTAALMAAAPVHAQQAVVSQLGKQEVTVYQQPWLNAEEASVLKLVATNEQALGLFVTRPGRYAAMAVAPGEGLIRKGQPVASAVAISDLPSAEAARKAALEGCEAAKRQGADCAIVLEVAPAR